MREKKVKEQRKKKNRANKVRKEIEEKTGKKEGKVRK